MKFHRTCDFCEREFGFKELKKERIDGEFLFTCKECEEEEKKDRKDEN